MSHHQPTDTGPDQKGVAYGNPLGMIHQHLRFSGAFGRVYAYSTPSRVCKQPESCSATHDARRKLPVMQSYYETGAFFIKKVTSTFNIRIGARNIRRTSASLKAVSGEACASRSAGGISGAISENGSLSAEYAHSRKPYNVILCGQESGRCLKRTPPAPSAWVRPGRQTPETYPSSSLTDHATGKLDGSRPGSRMVLPGLTYSDRSHNGRTGLGYTWRSVNYASHRLRQPHGFAP